MSVPDLAELSDEQRREILGLAKELDASLDWNPLQGYIPHPKQEIFHGSQVALKAFLGGNRSGKTTAGILDDLIQAVDEEILPDHLKPYKRWDPPFHCRVITPSYRLMNLVVLEKLRAWTPREQLEAGEWRKAFDERGGRLSFANDSSIDFLTYEMDLDKFGGAALHRIHFDEEPPGQKGQQIYRESLMRLIDYGGDTLFTLTPLLGLSWFFEDIYEPYTKGELRDTLLVEVDMDDNPHLDQEQKERSLRNLPPEERDARKAGKFVHFAGLVYPEFTDEHVLPDKVSKDHLEGLPIYVGIDPGIRHACGLLWVVHLDDDSLVVFDCLKLQGATAIEAAKAIQLTNAEWGVEPTWYVIDPAARNRQHQTGRSDQQEFADHGIQAFPGQNAVRPGINRLKERLRAHKLQLAPNCGALVDEFVKYRWQTPKNTQDDPRERPIKQNDHLLDPLRYICMARPYAPEESFADHPLSPAELAFQQDLERRKGEQHASPVGPGLYL